MSRRRRAASLSALALVPLLACRGDHGAAPTAAGAPATAPARDAAPARAPADAAARAPAAPAAPAEIELLHGTAAVVAVSSTVANPSIHPRDLVDGKLTTAWNSRTGDLRGAWIAFRVPAAAHVDKLRMTVGFTTTGPEGDYFTMNHRVRAVRVVRIGTDGDLGTHGLDPDARGLQDVAIDGPGGDFRIEVTDVVPGSKRSWRELCVSELEVWGTPPPGAAPVAQTPTVRVGSLDAPVAAGDDLAADDLAADDLAADELPSFPSVAAYCADFLARPAPGGPCPAVGDEDCDEHGVARCGDRAAAAPLASLPAGWTSARYFLSRAAHRRFTRCNLAITAGGRVHVLAELGDDRCGDPAALDDPTHDVSRYLIARRDDRLVLVLTRHTDLERSLAGHDEQYEETLIVCGGATPACIAPVPIGETYVNRSGGGEPGADGLELTSTGWRLAWQLDGDRLVLTKMSGTLDDLGRDRAGAHRIRW